MEEETIKAPKRKAGRPSKASLQRLANQQTEIERLVFLYENGYSDLEVCADLKLPWREFEKRLNNDDTFARLVEFGRLAAKAWWIAQGRKNLNDKSFQHPTWYANMKNRYGWADKTENTETTKTADNLSNEELEQKLVQALSKRKNKISALLGHKNVEVKEEPSDGPGQVH